MRGLKTGGRQKGTPNKVTASAREAIELAFQGLGGVNALTTWAKENPNEFYTRVWPRILPLQLSGDPENPLIPAPSPAEGSTTIKWLQAHTERVREKREAEEAAISNWLKETPHATAAQYIEQVKKISEALRERRTARSPL